MTRTFPRLRAFIALLALSTPLLTLSQSYNLVDNVTAAGFYSSFSFDSYADPTGGRVNYVDQATAQRLNLTYAGDNSFIMRADYTTVLDPNGPGRNSVRIHSNAQYTTHVVVFDIRHMPQGCATWPAAWEYDVNGVWPGGGEVDVIEGVNDESPNASTLHTEPGCTMPESRPQTGTTTGTDCNAFDNGNAGCGVLTTKPNNYGPAFNAAGGGYYVLERTPSFINIYFWSREDSSVPAEVAEGAASVTPGNWGTPVANFPDTSCDFGSEFAGNNVVFDLTLCGSWAGAVYGGDGCPGDCVDYVNNNPSAFADAYWDVKGVRIYT